MEVLFASWFGGFGWTVIGLILLVLAMLVPAVCGIRYIPNNRVGVVERLWSAAGPLSEGRIIALNREAGYQANVLRGGLHFYYYPWQYRIHKVPLTIIPEGKIGYVFARDGEPLKPEQTLGQVVPCNNFQDAAAFLQGDPETGIVGQRGRQRAILREGVYAINLALFVVITEDRTYCLEIGGREEAKMIGQWHHELDACGGFRPVIIGRRESDDESSFQPFPNQENPNEPATLGTPPWQDQASDNMGIVTVHEGPVLEPGQIIAPAVATDQDDPNYHNNYQDTEAFLAAGGRRGRQLVPLTDGTYFINRWFATVQLIPKTIVPIGYVGVVVSYFGKEGRDLSGEAFRHGERVGAGDRGVQTKTLCPGKYAFNAYAGRVHMVPTTNFVLHWITGRTEQHRYDESLKSIDLVTADAYEPVLPLSVVVHIDYQKAPSVIQRFGDIKKLITQTLDPMLSAYFRDIAHKKTMLELLHDRDMIQQEAKAELQRRFADFDIELVDVLIGKPDTVESSGEIERLLEQLRLRQLAREQIVTFKEQSAAAEKLRDLKMAQAKAEKQTELTQSQMDIQVAENRGSADLARAKMQAEQTVVTAEAEKKRKLLTAEAEGRSRALMGEGQSKQVAMVGEAEAEVLRQKVASYGDPRFYALALVAQHLSQSKQPLVPERVFQGGASDGDGTLPPAQGILGTLLSLLVAERTGLNLGQSRGDGKSVDGRPVVPAAKAEPLPPVESVEET